MSEMQDYQNIVQFYKKPLWRNLFFLVMVVLVHFSIFENQFVMDDFDFIVNWPLIQDLGNLPQFFIGYTPPLGQPGIYSPLKTLFHAFSYYFFEENSFGYHLISLAVHFAGTVFVFKIVQLLLNNLGTAFVAALIFLIHPTHVEGIVSMTGNIDMLGVVFMLVSFTYYIRSGIDRKSSLYVISIAFAFLAVFTHELTISLPVLFLFYNFCFTRDKEPIGKSVVKTLPFFAIVLFYVLCKYFVLGGITRGSYVYDSFYLTMLISIKAMAKYVWLCLFPLTLTHNHVISKGISSFDHADFDRFAVLSQSFFEPQVVVSLIVLGALFFIACKNYKKNPIITFSIGWFYICLMPTSNIIPSSVFFAERYLYPGIGGFCVLLALLYLQLDALQKSSSNKILRLCAMLIPLILIVFYVNQSYYRTKEFKNDITLFESAVRANPNSANMHNDLGIKYMQYGMYDRSKESFEKALAIQKDNPEIYFSIADLAVITGDLIHARQALEKATHLDQNFAEAYYNLAVLYQRLQMDSLAEEMFNQSMRLYHLQGRGEEAQLLNQAYLDYFGGGS